MISESSANHIARRKTSRFKAKYLRELAFEQTNAKGRVTTVGVGQSLPSGLASGPSTSEITLSLSRPTGSWRILSPSSSPT